MLHPRRLLPLVAATVLAFTSSAVRAADSKLNGWYPCSTVTFEEQLPDTADLTASQQEDAAAMLQAAQCAVMNAPLCYDGVCKETSDKTVEIFFKRITGAETKGKPNVFILQGGPGASSVYMESAMQSLFGLLEGNVNVYTMDHRGTGRSTKLDCVAAQAQMSGSPSGATVSPEEVPQCAAELQKRYGSDLSSFSITSAASDLTHFIKTFLKDSDSETFVYGVSYGTALVERLMHLSPPGVKGYILDGIATASGAPKSKFEYFSTWDPDYDEVGQVFLGSCAQNEADCGRYFKSSSVHQMLDDVVKRLDTPGSTCYTAVDEMFATVNHYTPGEVRPGTTLRQSMGFLLMDAVTRTFIPVLTYRLHRCHPDDVRVLEHFFTGMAESSRVRSEETFFSSDLVYKIIAYSEIWQTPTPSEDEMYARFLNTTLSSASYPEIAAYCAFTKENSTGCAPFADLQLYNASHISYKRDTYWNVAANLSNGTSVLLLSSKMDPQTPHKHAQQFFNVIQTEMKELVTFEHATHGTLWTTPISDTPGAHTCGMELLASFINVGGDLSKLNKSCVAQMPPINFKLTHELVTKWLNTKDPYDGPFVGSLSSSGTVADSATSSDFKTSSSSYATISVTFVGLFAVALWVAGMSV